MCPLILSLLLYFVGTKIPVITEPLEAMKYLRHGLYPPLMQNEDTRGINYDLTFDSLFQTQDSISDFMWNGQMGQNGGYSPILDPAGPLYYFPYHCEAIEERGIYASPVIAYIEQEDNTIQEKLVAQIVAHFNGMQKLLNTINDDPLLTELIGGGFDTLQENPQIREIEAVSKAYENRINMWSGESRQFTKMSFPDMEFFSKTFASQEELDEYIEHDDYGLNPERPAVCFAYTLHQHKHNKYELEMFWNDAIMLDYRSIPPQDEDAVNEFDSEPAWRSYTFYMFYGFAYVQNWAANTVLRHLTGNEDAMIASMACPMHMRSFTVNPFGELLYLLLKWFIMLIYIPLIYRVTYRIVKEKEQRTKETMQMMGMSNLSYWSSWLLYYTVINTIVSTVVWAVLAHGVLKFTGKTVVWLSLWLYGQTIYGYISLCQGFFRTARTAAVTTTIIYFGSITLQIQEYAPVWQKVMISLFPTGCMTQVTQVITGFELHAIGIQMHDTHRYYKNFSVQIGFSLYFVSFLVMNLLGFYIEKVTSTSAQPCFCLKKSFWSCNKLKRNKISLALENKLSEMVNYSAQTQLFETEHMNRECYESVPSGVSQLEINNKFMKVTGLRKQYGSETAVNGINLKLYQDQIFCLLGHNGAGKSSTISVLTGMFEPSGGKAEVYGIDMFQELDEVRAFLGICQQNDALFELLTTEEHLEIFYDFKSPHHNPEQRKAEIDKLMVEVGLDDKKNTFASKLSGGNMRKLSAALALCGGSKLIIFDEPTSGLDLTSRRKIWSMLKQYKKDRIVLLTTHCMDEADILADRIAIMTKGKISCLGSPLFLKKKFGVGYNLAIIKKEQELGNKILNFVVENLGPDVQKLSEMSTEISLQIPQNYSNNFKQFFTLFDKSLDELGIESYGMSITTLEDVFLKVGHLQDPFGGKTFENKEVVQDQNTNEEVGQTVRELAPSDLRTIDHDENQPNQVAPALLSERQEQILSEGKEDKQSSTAKMRVIDALENLPLATAYAETERDEEKVVKDKFSVEHYDSDFCTNFRAIFMKRLQLYQSWKAIRYEILLPVLIMVLGIGATSIELFKRSDSRLLDPSRISEERQLLLVNKDISVPTQDNITAETLASRLTSAEDWFDLQYTNNTMNFTEFYDFQYDYAHAHRPTFPYMYGAYQVYEANNDTKQFKFYAFNNATFGEGSVLYPQFMYDAILKVATGDDDFEFKVRNTPMPITNAVRERKVQGNAVTVIFISAVAYSLLITSIMGHVVNERVQGYKHMQLISGMDIAAYWCANFAVDFIKMEFTVIFTILCFVVFNLKYHTAWLTYLLFPFAAIPFTYVYSFAFSTVSSAQTASMSLNFGLIVFGSTIVSLCRWVQPWEKFADTLHLWLRMLPPYTLGQSVYFDAQWEDLVEFRLYTTGTGNDLDPNPWVLENILGDVLSMVVHFVLWMFVLFLIELGCAKAIEKSYLACCAKRYPRPVENLEQDENVAQEVQRISQKSDSELQIKVDKLRKVYLTGSGACNPGKPHLAIEQLSFGVSKGECFALLGVNGAGKTTTFKTLVAAENPTQGKVTVQGLDITKDFNKARKLLGYCPQFNPTFSSLTVLQNMKYYAKIKGIPSQECETQIKDILGRLDLVEHQHKAMTNLSGGMQRKLSVAVAILGNPPIILLDEPSTGMDPEARRFLWSVVETIAKNKSSAVVLTSHMMEEAEFLSTKMGIMIKGGIFKCFGTSQMIKQKYGKGYEIDIKIQMPSESVLEELISETLKSSLQEKGQDDIPHVFVKQTLDQLTSSGKLIQLSAQQIMTEISSIYSQTHNSGHNIQSASQKDSDDDMCIPAVILAEKIFTQDNLMKVIMNFCREFGSVDLLEQYGNYMRIRVMRQHKTIGQVFGMLDDLKEVYGIDQYSVSQTTLEQIFQSFANISFDQNVRKFEIQKEQLCEVEHALRQTNKETVTKTKQ